ncbi:MAG: translation initiation factor IF-3 [Candidatus Gastranaerophilaceae bacterium]
MISRDFNQSNNNALINEKIRSREVRLIDDEGNNHGVIATSKALAMAQDKDLDLVIVSPNQEPPVAKILDYGKYKYEINKRAKEAKKKQKVVELKEIKIRYKIDVHDYNVRIKSIKKFLGEGNKVKIVVMLRGREMQHNQLAYDLANRFLEDLKDVKLTVEKKPSLEGRNVITILAP